MTKKILEQKALDELGIQAFEGLFKKMPEKKVSVRYSSKFSSYNATIASSSTYIQFRLSRDFSEVGDEIKIGVMQYLLTRLHKKKLPLLQATLEMQLYDTFLKKIGEWHSSSGGKIVDKELEESFERINKTYFDSFMLAPTIKWGTQSKTRIGYYTFANDTVTLSTILKGERQEICDARDYVLYHELLHKKHKYEHKEGRTRSHTKEFRKDEAKFITQTGEDPEKLLERVVRNARRQTKNQRTNLKETKTPKKPIFVTESLKKWFGFD